MLRLNGKGFLVFFGSSPTESSSPRISNVCVCISDNGAHVVIITLAFRIALVFDPAASKIGKIHPRMDDVLCL